MPPKKKAVTTKTTTSTKKGCTIKTTKSSKTSKTPVKKTSIAGKGKTIELPDYIDAIKDANVKELLKSYAKGVSVDKTRTIENFKNGKTAASTIGHHTSALWLAKWSKILTEKTLKEIIDKFSDSHTRLVHSVPPVVEYKHDTKMLNMNLHWGQRKLMLTEIEFLGFVRDLAKLDKTDTHDFVVVYIGSADGRHLIPMIDQVFPKVFSEFHLYDIPKRYSTPVQIATKKGTRSGAKIKIAPYEPTEEGTVTGFFTDSVCENYTKKEYKDRVVFISDIRVNTDNESVLNDHLSQDRWIRAIKPYASMVKFRYPFAMEKGEIMPKYPHLSGAMFLQCYPPPCSNEVRLWTLHPKFLGLKLFPMHNGDTHLHENQMNVFNNVLRMATYKNNGGCACYDCSTEIDIVRRVTNTDLSDERITRWITRMCATSDSRDKMLEHSYARIRQVIGHIAQYVKKCDYRNLPSISTWRKKMISMGSTFNDPPPRIENFLNLPCSSD